MEQKRRPRRITLELSKEDKIKMQINEKQQSDLIWKQWLQKKNEESRDKIRKQQEIEEKLKKQQKENKEYAEIAYKQWLKDSANKQKPVKGSKGLDSFCSPKVSFYNPIPWKNILDDTNDNKPVKVLNKKPPCCKIKKTTTSGISEENIKEKRTVNWVRNVNKLSTPKIPRTTKQ